MGERAQKFAERFSKGWERDFFYRPAQKWRGILPAVQQAKRFRPDLLYVMDVAYTGVLAGTIASRLLRRPMVTDTGDAAYELAKLQGTYSAFQLALIRWVEQTALRRSHHIIVRGSFHKTWLEEQGFRRVTFIPDGVEVAKAVPVEGGPFRAKLGLANQFVVGMVGSMIFSPRTRMVYGWDIVEALGHLKGEPIKGLLVGDGDGRAYLEERAKELGVQENLVFTGRVASADLPRYLCMMDACVSTQSNDIAGNVRTTGKLPLYLAYNRYVIATDAGEARRVLPGVGCILPYQGVRDDAHPARLAVHLRELRADPTRLHSAQGGRAVALQHFDYDLLAQRVEAVCQEAISK